MKRNVLQVFVLTAGVIAIMLNAGCEEQQQLPSVKKSRLIAAENMELKKRLQQRDKEIEKLKEQHKKELEEQKGLLAECQKAREDVEEQLSGKFEEQINELFKSIGEESVKLQQENEKLKLQIEKLKTELEEAKKADAKQQSSQNYTDWISECIKRIQTIQPGATRGELFEVFATEGGLSTRSERTYVYKECPYIKVRVHFEAVDNEKWDENPGDVITEISKPYLEWSIMN